MRNILLVYLSCVFLASCSDPDSLFVRGGNGGGSDTTVTVERMSWWNEARFGMFIHYGLYSALEGEYIGKNVAGKDVHFETYGNNNDSGSDIQRGSGAGAEWILYEASIPRSNYKKYTSAFSGAGYNPEYIVSLAKAAGMKYIVLTAKHHDGFCLWDSKATDWDVASTPAGKLWGNDMIAPLAAAARKAGLKFGLYFSHARDWMHTGALGPIPELSNGTYPYTDNQTYMRRYTYPMLQEMLQRYHPDIIWWDSPDCNPYAEFADSCRDIVRNFDPNILQNDRVSSLSDYNGDFETPEQGIDESKEHAAMEMCTTMNSTWGYNQFDSDWKPAEYLLFNLLRVNKMGGNLLLNVGPRADGSIPQKSVERLQELAMWMDVNESSVHGTLKSLFQYNLPYGPVTYRTDENKPRLFYQIFYWDGSGELWLPGILNAPEDVNLTFLATPQLSFHVEQVEGIGLHLTGLPTTAPSTLCTTLQISFKNKPNVVEGTREINGTIHLDALAAHTRGGFFMEWDKKPCYNWYGGAQIDYKLIVPKDGTYAVSAQLAAFFTGTITLNFNNGTTLVGYNTVTPSGHANYERQSLGTVTLSAGTYLLHVTSLQSNSWLKLRDLEMVRI